jgi:EpsI family protein
MSFKRTIIASIIMISTMICVHYMSYSEDVKLNKPFSTFPKKIGEWTGKEEHFDQAVYDVLGVSDSYLANYSNREGNGVQIYIGYYESQREGQQIHSPKNCMPGSGWNITETSLEDITLKGDDSQKKIKVIKLLLEKDNQKQVVLYWYQSNGRFISSEYSQRMYMVIDSITKHRTDGSFVRLISPVQNNDEEAAVKHLKDFTVELIPVLKEYIPS